MSKKEFFVGKSVFGFLIAVVQSVAIVCIMGFLMGFISPNQMAAAANMKLLFLPISITIIGAVMLSPNMHFLLYWSPFYWMYDGLNSIFRDMATWSQIGWDCLWIIIITAIVFWQVKIK